jgi:hypothetical protein
LLAPSSDSSPSASPTCIEAVSALFEGLKPFLDMVSVDTVAIRLKFDPTLVNPASVFSTEILAEERQIPHGVLHRSSICRRANSDISEVKA